MIEIRVAVGGKCGKLKASAGWYNGNPFQLLSIAFVRVSEDYVDLFTLNLLYFELDVYLDWSE